MHRFYWLIPDLLAGSSRPGAPDDDPARLQQDLAFLRQQGIDALLSLTEQPVDPWAIAQEGLAYAHIPIDDMTAPQPTQFMAALQFIDEQRLHGRRTVVHCLAGQGRAGSILAAYLIRTGLGSDAALKQLRMICPGAVENDEQVAALERFARHQPWLV